jgi:hypothetical protein
VLLFFPRNDWKIELPSTYYWEGRELKRVLFSLLLYFFFFLFVSLGFLGDTNQSLNCTNQFSDYQIIEMLPSCIDFYNKVLKIMLNPPISSKLC